MKKLIPYLPIVFGVFGVVFAAIGFFSSHIGATGISHSIARCLKMKNTTFHNLFQAITNKGDQYHLFACFITVGGCLLAASLLIFFIFVVILVSQHTIVKTREAVINFSPAVIISKRANFIKQFRFQNKHPNTGQQTNANNNQRNFQQQNNSQQNNSQQSTNGWRDNTKRRFGW